MLSSESVRINEQQLTRLRKLVSQGEGLTLEFKRKAAHPDKIVREMIAFANMQGGTLLIGVGDDKSIPGVKYPEEELMAIQQAVHLYCKPAVVFTDEIIAVSPKHYVLRLDISVVDSRPHYFSRPYTGKESFVRSGDMSVKASNEMLEIVRRSRKSKDMRFTFGDAEKKLMEYLEMKKSITLDEFRTLANINRFKATRKLIVLVLANVLRITPTEKGDLFSRN